MAEKDLVFGIKVDSKSAQNDLGKVSKEAKKLENQFNSLNSVVESTAQNQTELEKTIQNADKALKDYNKGLAASTKNLKNYDETTDSAAGTTVALSTALATTAAILPKFNQSAASLAGIFKTSLTSGFMIARHELEVFKEGIRAATLRGIPGLIDKLLTANVAFLGLSAILRATGDEADTFSEKIIFVAAIALSGLNVAFQVLSRTIGDFVSGVGRDLIALTFQFSESFVKLEQSVKGFEFTIIGFNKTFGEDAIGSLQEWSDTFDEINASSSQNANNIRKAIALFVKESQVLGLSVKQNQELLKGAADLAAATGQDIDDITRRLLAGIAGQSNAVVTLGINVKNTSEEIRKFGSFLNKGVNELTGAELVQARYNATLEQLTPLAGAAASEVRTLTGAQAFLNKQVEVLQGNLGRQADLTRAVITAFGDLVGQINELPDFLIMIAGDLLELGGAFLFVAGKIIAVVGALVSIVSLFRLLNVVMAQSIATQALATKAFTVMGTAVKASTVPVKNLTTFFLNLATVTRASLILALKDLSRLFSLLITQTKALTVAMLANPLFRFAVGIAAAIGLIAAAVKELSDDFERLNREQRKNQDISQAQVAEVGVLTNAYLALKQTVVDAFEILKTSAKFIVIGLISALKLAALAVLEFINIFGDFDFVNNEIKRLNKELSNLGEIAEKSVEKLNKELSFSALFAAEAAEASRKHGEALKEFGNISSKVFTAEQARERVFGTNVEKALLKAQDLNEERALITEKIKRKEGDINELLKEQVRLTNKTKLAWADVEKIVTDSLDAIETGIKKQRIDTLKANDELVAAQKIINAERLRAFDEQAEALNKTGVLTERRLKTLEKARKTILDQNKALIDQAKIQQNQKQSEELKATQDILKKNEDIRKSILMLNDDNLSVIEKQRNESIAGVEAQIKGLRAVNKLSKEREDALNTQIDLINQQADLQREQAAIQKGGEVSGFLSQAGDIAGGLGEGLGDALGGALSGVGEALTSAAVEFGLGAAGSFITAVLAIPDLLAGIGGFIDKITNIGPAIAEAFDGLVQSLLGFVMNFIPNLITSLGDIVDTIITDLLIGLPDAFIALSEAIPNAMSALIERLPELIQGLVSGLIAAFPKLVIALVNLFVKQSAKITVAIVKALPEIGEAIIAGIFDALKEIGELITKLFSGEALTDSISDSITEGVGEGLKASSSEVFQVLELEQERFAKGAGTFIEESTDKAISDWRKFWKFVSKLWEGLIKILSQVWDTIIFAVETVFNFVRDKIFQPIVDAFEIVFTFVKDKIFQPIFDAFNKVVVFLQSVFTTFTDAFESIWTFVDQFIIGPLTSLIDGIISIAGKILNPIIDLLNALKIPGQEVSTKVLGKKIQFQLWPDIDLIPVDIPRIAAQEGGLVPGSGIGDIVPALLEPGEFVLNKDAVAGLGLGTVNNLNQGQPAGASITFAPIINVSGGNFEPKQVIDDMFTELRRRSSNGTKVIFAQGIKT